MYIDIIRGVACHMAAIAMCPATSVYCSYYKRVGFEVINTVPV